MNGNDIAIRVKRLFGDESGAQITDEDIIHWINDAQRDIAQAQRLLEAKATTSGVAGVSEYSLPANQIEIKHVYYDNAKLEWRSIQEFEQEYNAGLTGNPCVYTSWGEYIQIRPSPSADGDLVIYFSEFPDDITALADNLTIPVRYHQRALEHVMTHAYELDENFEAAAYKSGQFSAGMAYLAGEEQWDGKESYPFITVRDEDL